MVPLLLTNGKSIEIICSQFADRDFIIWGAGSQGKILKRLFERRGMGGKIIAFCDSDQRISKHLVSGVPVIDPQSAIERCKKLEVVILIAISSAIDVISSLCIRNGLTENINFVKYYSISRPEVVIQISPDCISKSVDYMSFDKFKLVLNKLISDIPGILLVDLTGFGDPANHHEVDKIISYTEQHLPCSITVGVGNLGSFRRILNAEPSLLTLSVGGFPIGDEFLNPNIDWVILESQLILMAEFQGKLKNSEFRVLYTKYANQDGKDRIKLVELCGQYGIKMVEGLGYLNPYEKFIAFYQNPTVKSISENEKLIWPVGIALDLAYEDRNLPCLCQRIFPVIGPNLEVSTCHLYKDTIEKDYLAVSFKKIQESRSNSKQCRECQSYGLHRLDIDVIQRRRNLKLVC